ncbi:hypothetical protein P7K49_037315 [Saguinus oedipus]|uniref:Uncharacterized protein n=1 Tax=Saguinus oedipus TaxID=9490 RepID=A0ABQ9THQ9_SAGOE|nr:hypothetical protein P7K49_037315 [Saguinus oedipus]
MTVMCTQGYHKHIQNMLTHKLDLTIQSRDPQFTKDRELLMDREENPLDMASLVTDKKHRQGQGQQEAGDVVTVSPVTVKFTQGSHTHIQDTHTAKVNLNMQSHDPQFMGDTELLMNRQEIALDMASLVMDSPHRQGPGQLEDRDLATLSPVTVRCTQGSHTHIQDTHTAKVDLNMQSHDPQFMGDTELLMNRQEIALDMASLVMDSPHRQGPGQLEDRDLATLRPLTVRCTQGSHTHIQDTHTAKVDLNMQSHHPQFMADMKLLMDRQEIALDMASLVMDSPHRQGPGQL